MELTPDNIRCLVISNEPWGNIRFSKHHYAIELSKRFDTIFVGPPTGDAGWIGTEIDIRQEGSDQLRIATYSTGKMNKLDSSRDLKVLKKLTDPDKINLIWQFDPFRFGQLPEGAKRIYHVVDPYHDAKLNELICQDSDLIVCVNEMIASHYESYAHKRAIISHGFDGGTRFSETDQDILLAGTINHSTDLVLLLALLDRLENIRLVFVGTIDHDDPMIDEIYRHRNFYDLPPQPPNELLDLVANAKVCIVPYRMDGIHAYRSPLKICTYARMGKPVVTTNPNFEPVLSKACVHHANDHESFIELVLKGTKGELPVDREIVEKSVQEHAYNNKVDRILNLVFPTTKPTTLDS